MIIIRRIKYLLNVLTGRVFNYRNTHNVPQIRKRVLLFIPWYILSTLVALLDLIFLGELFSLVLEFTSPKRRRLTAVELELFAELKSDQRYLSRVVVIENSWLAQLGKRFGKRQQLGLGVARTVHFSREVALENDKQWLIHEVGHTLQYKYRGLCYIPEALIAQTFSGYKYGGKETLISIDRLRCFNPEQQADIFVAIICTNVKSKLRHEIVSGNW